MVHMEDDTDVLGESLVNDECSSVDWTIWQWGEWLNALRAPNKLLESTFIEGELLSHM